MHFRFSIRTLGALVAVVAGMCAPPAYILARIRAEARTADLLEAAQLRDGAFSPHVYCVEPNDQYWRFAYWLAGSRGMVVSADIIGDESASVLILRGASVPHLRDLRIFRDSTGTNERTRLSQLQIVAAAHVPTLEQLDVHAYGASGLDLSPLAALAGLVHCHIEADALPADCVAQLHNIKAGNLQLWGTESDAVLPAKACSSFARSTATHIHIHAQVGDEAFANIARAPYLVQLHIEHVERDLAVITDRGLRLAAPHLRARGVCINPSEISDASIDVLAQMKQLQCVSLEGSKITPKGAKRLAELRPDLELIY